MKFVIVAVLFATVAVSVSGQDGLGPIVGGLTDTAEGSLGSLPDVANLQQLLETLLG